MSETKKLNVGDKYLSVKIVGHEPISAFKNTEGKEKNPQAPDYKGDGIAVWINEKKEPKTKPSGEL